MSIKNKIKEFQDASRDAGWRIKSINFREEGETEKFYETSPKIIRTISNFSLLVLIILLIWKFSGGPAWCGVGVVLSFVSILVCTFLSNVMTCHNFIAVDAVCIDREIQDYKSHSHKGRSSTHYTFRTLCEFEYEGNTYKVTPECLKLVAFNSEKQVENYLKKHINDNGSCTLMVNPQNPLQTIIGKKPLKS